MKLITLNIWGGRIHEPLVKFLKNNQSSDIFCLQEVYTKETPKEAIIEFGGVPSIYSDIETILPNHQGYFHASLGTYYGLAIFVKKDITLLEEGSHVIHDPIDYQGGGNHTRNLTYITYEKEGVLYTVINVHGLWNGKGKGDFPERISQSKFIKYFLNSKQGPKILCGDFNLRPDTQSLAIVAEGMRNLVTEYGVTSTRTSIYTKPEKFADYMFTSPEINVRDFRVLPDEVSDHAALLLEF